MLMKRYNGSLDKRYNPRKNVFPPTCPPSLLVNRPLPVRVWGGGGWGGWGVFLPHKDTSYRKSCFCLEKDKLI